MYNTNPRSDVQRGSIELLLKQTGGLRVDCTSLLFFRHTRQLQGQLFLSLKSTRCTTAPSGPPATKASPAAVSAISEIADRFPDVYVHIHTYESSDRSSSCRLFWKSVIKTVSVSHRDDPLILESLTLFGASDMPVTRVHFAFPTGARRDAARRQRSYG